MLRFAGHEIDLGRKELRRGGEPVHVEPQVFDLLVHLIENRARVVSKDELLDVVWSGRIVSEAALSSRINAARRALGDDGDRQELIRTIHKRGFRFMGDVLDEAPAAAPAPVPVPVPAAMPAPLPGPSGSSRKPSIVVLPFVDLNPDAGTEYFAYGLTEDIIRLLARNRWLDVLSRHSGAAFGDRQVPLREIAAALGVRYLMQGSVLKRGQNVRIVADLICAETDRQLWSEIYDLPLMDIMPVTEAMARQIAAVMEPEMARIERELAMRKPPDNLDAWDSYQRGLWNLWGFTKPSMDQAEEMFRQAITLDPSFARAYGALSYVNLQRVFLSPPDQRPRLLAEAMRGARVAVSLDDRDCMNLCVLGRAHCMLGEYDDAIAVLEQCVEMNPSFAQGYFALAFALTWCGREIDALTLVERAIELSPRDPHLTSFHLLRALAHFALGDLEAVVSCSRIAMRLRNASHTAFALHAAALGLSGRAQAAQATVEELRRRVPDYSCAYGRSDLFFCSDQAVVERFAEGLALVGIPETAAVASGTV